MYIIYVLKSDRNGKRYVGYSAKSREKRLQEHNSGTNKFTRQNRPFRLVYTESYPTKIEAMKRERFLKSGKGREFLNEVIGPLA